MRPSPVTSAALLLAALAPAGTQAALLDITPPFTISPIFYDVSGRVRAAAIGDGFVVVWSTRETLESPAFVNAARLDTAGNLVGTEFPVATSPSEVDKSRPSLQSFPDGKFVVGWIEAHRVRARRFNVAAIEASDALRILRASVGQPQPLDCS